VGCPFSFNGLDVAIQLAENSVAIDTFAVVQLLQSLGSLNDELPTGLQQAQPFGDGRRFRLKTAAEHKFLDNVADAAGQSDVQ
jgi:hypothetical protein